MGVISLDINMSVEPVYPLVQSMSYQCIPKALIQQQTNSKYLDSPIREYMVFYRRWPAMTWPFCMPIPYGLL